MQGIGFDVADDLCLQRSGFWRRKTGYIRSMALIVQSQFDGDVPKDIDELCSLPGVGPKMVRARAHRAYGFPS